MQYMINPVTEINIELFPLKSTTLTRGNKMHFQFAFRTRNPQYFISTRRPGTFCSHFVAKPDNSPQFVIEAAPELDKLEFV